MNFMSPIQKYHELRLVLVVNISRSDFIQYPNPVSNGHGSKIIRKSLTGLSLFKMVKRHRDSRKTFMARLNNDFESSVTRFTRRKPPTRQHLK